MNKISAFFLLILVFPFLLLISSVVFLIEQENPFFKQIRIGKNKVPFKLIKLRTMKKNQITSIGSILRKTGIDEIPQLLNIIKGNMNFIGPRPLTQSDILRLGWESDFYNLRWNIKPGLTGLSQLSPICNKKISFFYDKYYVENENFRINISIFFLSFLVPIIGKTRVKSIVSKRNKKC